MARGIAAAAAALIALAFASSANAADSLRAGAGRADITPPTGYYMMGWVRSDAQTTGAHTRLYARVLVLQRGGQKVALVAEDLNGIPGGMLQDAAKLVADRGFTERNVLDSASHTHAAPSQYYNFGAYNTVFMTAGQPTEVNTDVDPQLYGFMVRRLAEAIRRADDDLAPARAGWATGKLLGLTQNRSLEAHLADHGILKEPGEGQVSDDPGGYEHTIDPEVHVLRVDKVKGKKRVPIGIWSTFADHGTVNRYTFHFYNRDHHGAATQVAEDAIRKKGRVARKQDVVNVYGNTDEGDMSAGLTKNGPAYADYVGRVEAASMQRLWRQAGKSMSAKPKLALRWTRVCFCGQDTEEGRVDSTPVIGFPLLTGSEEGRGPLYDQTGVSHEGKTQPIDNGPQGHKIPVIEGSDVPHAVPLMAVRVGDGMMVSVPGEMTVDMGRRVRGAVADAVAGHGIARVVISGLANEYLQYFTTPEEYDRQHYEGGSMLFGRTASIVVRGGLVQVARALVNGQPAPDPYAYDPVNGLKANDTPFPTGAAAGKLVAQPKPVKRLERAEFRWTGGPKGEDRPLDKPFVRIERRVGRRWRAYGSDLGLQILWEVDDDGGYRALWEVPLSAPVGKYRFRITANRYKLPSSSFKVSRSTSLAVTSAAAASGVAVKLAYPEAVTERDLTYRPPFASGGRVAFRVNGARIVVRSKRGQEFTVADGGAQVFIPPGAARDRYGNINGRALTLGG
jgi:neutral ceramidase